MSSFSLDQLLADLQNVSRRARNAYESNENETRLEPIVLNRNPSNQRNQTLNLIRPDSIINAVSFSRKTFVHNFILFCLGTSAQKFGRIESTSRNIEQSKRIYAQRNKA